MPIKAGVASGGSGKTAKGEVDLYTGTDGKKFKDVEIVRSDVPQIVIPKTMTIPQAIKWLDMKAQMEEKKVSIYHKMKCYPLDGLYALDLAMERTFGFNNLKGFEDFFGNEMPPTMVSVRYGPKPDQFKQVPYGKLQPPVWEGGFLNAEFGPKPELVISGEVKKKHEDMVHALIQMTQDQLTNHSIYKGKAVTLDLRYMDNPREFNIVDSAPQFMDLDKVNPSDLILNDETQLAVDANIYLPLRGMEDCIANNIPLKYGCLLAGPYGTGKTMTARTVGKVASDNGWTFLYLRDAKHVAAGLRMAELYAPAVLFAEDIDRATGGDRDAKLDEILNTIDGLDTKEKPIITILTTNNLESIHPGFLRPGRIDSLILMDKPDVKSAGRFVQLYAKDEDGVSLLSEDIDLVKVGESLQGFVPAFISNAVQQAKKAAISRNGRDIRGKITTDELISVGKLLRSHEALVNRNVELSVPERTYRAFQFLYGDVNPEIQLANTGRAVHETAGVAAQ